MDPGLMPNLPPSHSPTRITTRMSARLSGSASVVILGLRLTGPMLSLSKFPIDLRQLEKRPAARTGARYVAQICQRCHVAITLWHPRPHEKRSQSHQPRASMNRNQREDAIRRNICAPYFFTMPAPTPCTASNSASFLGAAAAILSRARSPKILNAGTRLRLASLKRQARNACSIRGISAPDQAAGLCLVAACGAAAARGTLDFPDFFAGLRLDAGRGASFMTKGTGVVSLVARPAGVRLTVR